MYYEKKCIIKRLFHIFKTLSYIVGIKCELN